MVVISSVIVVVFSLMVAVFSTMVVVFSLMVVVFSLIVVVFSLMAVMSSVIVVVFSLMMVVFSLMVLVSYVMVVVFSLMVVDSVHWTLSAALLCFALLHADCVPGRDLEDRESHHHGAGRLGEGDGDEGADTELLCQQLPRTVQPPPGGRGCHRGSQVSRCRSVLRQVHLRHSGHTQGLGEQDIQVPRKGGYHPLPFVF